MHRHLRCSSVGRSMRAGRSEMAAMIEVTGLASETAFTRSRGTDTHRRTGTALMIGLFCSSFQFFHSFGKAFETQPLAPYLLLEITLAALLVFASLTIAMQVVSGRVRPLDLFFFLFPLVWLALSAGFAWLMFDQPPIFGIGEDRRILTFLYWFAFDAVRRRFGLTVTDILRALLLC